MSAAQQRLNNAIAVRDVMPANSSDRLAAEYAVAAAQRKVELPRSDDSAALSLEIWKMEIDL